MSVRKSPLTSLVCYVRHSRFPLYRRIPTAFQAARQPSETFWWDYEQGHPFEGSMRDLQFSSSYKPIFNVSLHRGFPSLQSFVIFKTPLHKQPYVCFYCVLNVDNSSGSIL